MLGQFEISIAGGIEGADWSESPWLVASNVPGGATADNAASPEVIVENASQLQDAVDNALSRGTKRIILRDGVYMLSSSLVLHGLDSFTLEVPRLRQNKQRTYCPKESCNPFVFHDLPPPLLSYNILNNSSNRKVFLKNTFRKMCIRHCSL